jgi:Holliday junction DNA helicase RuvB
MRLLDPKFNQDNSEIGLRPTSFDEYIGQRTIVENIKIMIASAKVRAAAVDHILLSGPPGLGKTSLALILAKKMNTEIHTVSGPNLTSRGDLATILINLNPLDILFIDEIHRMSNTVEEILYSAMEDFSLDIIMGKGMTSKIMKIKLNPFTLVGATTRPALLTKPLRDRFLAHLHFDYYKSQDLMKIIELNSKKLHVTITDTALERLSLCSRGTPRISNRLLRRMRDYALFQNRSTIDLEVVEKSLKLMEIDYLGLDVMDRKILKIIDENYNGGPVGIEAIAATLNEDKDTIIDIYEPFLLQIGMINRSSRGRLISEKGKKHLIQCNP